VDNAKNRHSMDFLRKKSTIQQILFLLVLVIGFVWLDRCSKKDDEARFLKGDFAIGYIDEYTIGLAKGSSTGFYYHFSCNDKKYHYFNDKGIKQSLESWKLPPRDERKKIKQGDKFLVMFDENGSRLFFKYPIRDSADFKQYIKLIEQERAENIKKTP
jgi:hypothetical protein